MLNSIFFLFGSELWWLFFGVLAPGLPYWSGSRSWVGSWSWEIKTAKFCGWETFGAGKQRPDKEGAPKPTTPQAGRRTFVRVKRSCKRRTFVRAKELGHRPPLTPQPSIISQGAGSCQVFFENFFQKIFMSRY